MKQLNRYYRYAKISVRQTRQIIKLFALDLTADKTIQLTQLTCRSVRQLDFVTNFRLSKQMRKGRNPSRASF